MPSATLDLAHDSVRRLFQIEDELELMRSRIGGQGTGIGTRIDHTTVLDVMRNVDEYIDASEGELSDEREYCERDVDAGWVVLFGAEALMADEGVEPGLADRLLREVAARYLYDGQGGTSATCAAVTRWMDARGLAHMRAAARRA